MSQIQAPHFSANRAGKKYPNDGARLGPAWQAVWDALVASGEDYLDGNELSRTVAKTYELGVPTVRNLLTIAAAQGMLQSELRRVQVELTRGGQHVSAPYTRSFYRITPA